MAASPPPTPTLSAASHRRREALPGGERTFVVQRGRQGPPQARQLQQLRNGEPQDGGPEQVEEEASEPRGRAGGQRRTEEASELGSSGQFQEGPQSSHRRDLPHHPYLSEHFESGR